MRSKDLKSFIGKLVKPHGLWGYIYFHYYGKDLSILKEYKGFYVGEDYTFKLKQLFEKANRLIIQFDQCSNRNEAESLRDKEVYVLETDLPSLEEGEHYLYQLEGLNVLNTEDKLLGIVEGTIGTKSNEVLVVKNTDNSIDDKERLIPYIKSEVVKEISLDKGYVLVDWPEDF